MQEMATKDAKDMKNTKSEKDQAKTQNCFRSIFAGSDKVLVGFIIGVLLMFTGVNVYYPKLPKIAVVDINKIVDEFVKNTAKKKLAPEKMKQEVAMFGINLEKELVATTKKQNLVLLPSEAVIAGAIDLTKNMQQKLYNE